MRARPPVTRVEAQDLVVRTELTAADGSELPALEVTLPRRHADLLDPTATASVAVLTALAAARGEDLVVEGEVDDQVAEAAPALAALLAGWWGTAVPHVEIEATFAPEGRGDGVALFFTRGVDSWSTLLDLLDAPPGDRVTHLVAVQHGDEAHRPVDAGIIDRHRAIAAELRLELVTMATTARATLDAHQPWARVVGPALVSTGLVAGAGLRRLVYSGVAPAHVPIRTGSDPDVIGRLATSRTEVVLGNPDRFRHERIAHIAAHPIARDSLQVCWVELTEGNCGRCNKCLATMSGLALAGDPDPSWGFDTPLDVDRVRQVRLTPSDASGLALALAEGLGPDHEELRRAWADVWAELHGEEPRPRWGDGAPPGLAGPSLARRVAAGLRATTGQAEAPMTRPLGWRPGSVPLRPALADHERVRAQVATGPGRPRAWAVVESQVRDGRRDGAQADLALRCQDAFGPGATYLPGILRVPDAAPVLDHDAVAALLGVARARLWWREGGDLDPLRLVETIEQGCLPLQVMPDGPARELAAALPPALAALVVAEGDLARLDLGTEAVAYRLAPAADHLLAGSADHGLMAGAHGG